MAGREFTPIKGSWPDPKKVKCKDCKFRDRTAVEINGRMIYSGIVKSFCDKYVGYDKGGNYKPNEILFQNADCEYYEKEK